MQPDPQSHVDGQPVSGFLDQAERILEGECTSRCCASILKHQKQPVAQSVRQKDVAPVLSNNSSEGAENYLDKSRQLLISEFAESMDVPEEHGPRKPLHACFLRSNVRSGTEPVTNADDALRRTGTLPTRHIGGGTGRADCQLAVPHDDLLDRG
jgi:hypothetical protein